MDDLTTEEAIKNIHFSAEDRQQRLYTPERRLMFAVIERAYFDLQLSDQTLRIKARKWVRSDDRGAWSFLWLCEMLDYNAKAFQELLLSRCKFLS